MELTKEIRVIKEVYRANVEDNFERGHTLSLCQSHSMNEMFIEIVIPRLVESSLLKAKKDSCSVTTEITDMIFSVEGDLYANSRVSKFSS